jgi:hypothetical protein
MNEWSAYHWNVISVSMNPRWHNITGVFSVCSLYQRNKEAWRLRIIAQPTVVTLNTSDTCGPVNQPYISTHRQAKLQNRITINNNNLPVRFKMLSPSFLKSQCTREIKKTKFRNISVCCFLNLTAFTFNTSSRWSGRLGEFVKGMEKLDICVNNMQ